MAQKKKWVSNDLRVKNAVPSFFNNIFERVKNWTISGLLTIFPPIETNIEEMKEEIWADLSSIYYKYEDDGQKRAFKEVVGDMSKKVSEGDWGVIYEKLYRLRV
jgi:hypothetical protein